MDPKCSCNQHDIWTKDCNFRTYKIKSNKFTSTVVSNLVKSGHISKRSTYLCTSCAEHSKEIIESKANSNIKRIRSFSDSVKEVIEGIEAGDISKDNLILLARAIGKSQSLYVSKDCDTFSNAYRDDAYLKTYKPSKWLSNRNEIVVSFVQGVSGVYGDFDDNKRNVALARAVEQVYYVNNTSLVAPLSFLTNLLCYFITGSKSACTVNAGSSPSGSYNTILNWINNQAETPLSCPVGCDVISNFDNNQILARNWRVRFNSKAMLSVITTLVHLIPDESSTLQMQPELSPSIWLYNGNLLHKQAFLKMKSVEATLLPLFRVYRNTFVDQRIKHVMSEQIINESIMDHVDAEINFFSKTTLTDHTDVISSMVNFSHGESHAPTFTRENKSTDQYDNLRHGHPSHPTKVVMGNPCLVNPCSYRSVSIVLDHILSETCGDGKRSWTIIGCDGLPYIIGSRLIERTYVCPCCNSTFEALSEFKSHCEKVPNLNSDIHTFKKYKNILLVPGLGHIEINMVKSMFKLLWNVVLIDIAKMLGFRSPKALASCQAASNHHKSWQILEIFYIGTADELILQYCRECIEQKSTPSVSGFYNWSENVKNPNYKFLMECVFTFAVALNMYRTAMRRNNSSALWAARCKFSSLFYGLHQTNYQELDTRDLYNRVLAPNEIDKFLCSHESMSVSGNPSKGEGGDFILESKNRRIKMWMPPGLPNEAKWLRVCRNIDKLEEVRQNMMTTIGVKDNENRQTNTNLELEIKKWRATLRASGYLKEPHLSVPHKAFSGQALDVDLTNFSFNSIENKRIYRNEVEENQDLGKRIKLTPIFILHEDRNKFNDIRKKTKPELQIVILGEIDKLRELAPEIANTFLMRWDKIKMGTKSEWFLFLNEIGNNVEDALRMNEEENTDWSINNEEISKEHEVVIDETI